MEETTRLTRPMLAFWGAVGAIAPEVILFYSKRFTMPALEFSLAQYIVASVLYLALAATVATIFPYGRRRAEWKAFGVGAGLPVVVSALAAAVRPQMVTVRGEGPISGGLIDLMAMF